MHVEILADMAQLDKSAGLMKDNRLYKNYVAVAPRPEDWPVLFDKMHDLLMQDHDWSAEVATIQAPTLLMVGTAMPCKPATRWRSSSSWEGDKRDANWASSGLGLNRLAVLPGVTHYTMFASPALAAAATPFLEARCSAGGHRDRLVLAELHLRSQREMSRDGCEDGHY
jgi:hypothetical protein